MRKGFIEQQSVAKTEEKNERHKKQTGKDNFTNGWGYRLTMAAQLPAFGFR
jgi:hypothetical protein